MNRLATKQLATPLIRTPAREDGAAVWQLVGETGGLEQNSAYAYLLLCTHFHDTCVVADRDGELLGCVLAYRPPREPGSLFVWQVGVAPAARGQGLGGEMLDAAVKLPACRNVQFITASVAADNRASRGLFAAFARRHNASIAEQEFLPADCFPHTHAAEPLLKIGPLH
ncbi:MAG TPA: diaminobutyrate acetyltransferase [Gammaproteobacteria bacterium]|nr:diaminobutyrate acetyltransferase [Gammaproteobacteria bacterium]